MQPYNTNPYDSQEYESQALPYIPYNAPSENTVQSYNAPEDIFSNELYPPAPSVYENTSPYAHYAQDLPVTPQPAPYEPLPPISADPLAASPSGKKKRRLWLPIGIAILILLVGATSIFALLTYLNRSTPTKTLDTFCSALQDGKYQIAYDQLTPTMQTNFTESQFATLLSSDSVAVCSHGATSENGISATTDLHLYHKVSKGTNNDKVVVTKDAHGQWKISNIQKVS
jgi:hypothetical protein